MDNSKPGPPDNRQAIRVRLDPHGHWRRMAPPSMARCKEAFQSLPCFTCATGNSAVTAASEAANAHESSPARCCVDFGAPKDPYIPAAVQEGAVQKQQMRPTEKPPASSQREEKGGTRGDQRADGSTVVWYAPEDTYTPLYFGSSPEDAGTGHSHKCDSFFQYAGVALGAVSGLIALGIGFIFLAAGLAVHIGSKSILAQYSTVQTYDAENKRRGAPK